MAACGLHDDLQHIFEISDKLTCGLTLCNVRSLVRHFCNHRFAAVIIIVCTGGACYSSPSSNMIHL
jgi:hypothetical protein